MTDSSDMDVFDSITSGAAEANAPVIESNQEIIEPQQGQQRDEQGRFATKADAPVIEHEQPVQTETHAENGKAIPVGAMQAEREKRQAAQAEAEALRREIAELRGMVTAQRQPAKQAPQQEEQPPEVWGDPDAWLRHNISPVQQQMAETREMLMELQATQLHGAEAVAAAKEAVKTLFGTPEGAVLAQKPGNLFDNMVAWHRQQQVMARIGTDPDAFLKAEQEKWLNDPAVQAQVIALARGNAVQPGNRSQQPVTSIPPSLSRLPAGGNVSAGEQESDAGMFASVTSGRRG